MFFFHPTVSMIPPTQSSTVDGVYYNTAAIRKGHAVEDEEIAPQIPPHTVEKLYTAVMKKPKGSANQSEELYIISPAAQTDTIVDVIEKKLKSTAEGEDTPIQLLSHKLYRMQLLPI